MAKKKTSQQVINDLTCPSCGVISQPTAQHCNACGYMWYLSDDIGQPKDVKPELVEESNV